MEPVKMGPMEMGAIAIEIYDLAILNWIEPPEMGPHFHKSTLSKPEHLWLYGFACISLNVSFRTAAKTTTVSVANYEQNFVWLIRKFFLWTHTMGEFT